MNRTAGATVCLLCVAALERTIAAAVTSYFQVTLLKVSLSLLLFALHVNIAFMYLIANFAIPGKTL